MTLKDLEKVLYCESYIVIDPGETTLTEGELLTEEEVPRRPSTSSARTPSRPAWAARRPRAAPSERPIDVERSPTSCARR
jgi:hypothetical protein